MRSSRSSIARWNGRTSRYRSPVGVGDTEDDVADVNRLRNEEQHWPISKILVISAGQRVTQFFRGALQEVGAEFCPVGC
ncbi:hypothetical protein [Streptomyces phytophilus]|uniref:hypothetical protein n=1 Tax=Streptomyces phytophilus TaxID=722715 RepID=UPI0015F03E73|nr:hypothetical protein [Streptomyces phytophilus]